LNVAILLAVGVVVLILQRRFWNGREARQRQADLPGDQGAGAV
jgi:hypothetical protein